MTIHQPIDRDRARAKEMIARLWAQAEGHARDMERLHGMILRIAEASGMDLREALGDAPSQVAVPAERLAPRERPILILWRQGKLSDGQYMAAERLTALIRLKERTQRVVAWASGFGSGGGSDAVSDGMARALDAASQWGMLQARILIDQRCGADIEHRRRVFAILELACGAEMSARAIVRHRGDLGSARDVSRRLKTGLQVVAESLGDVKAHRDAAGEENAA